MQPQAQVRPTRSSSAKPPIGEINNLLQSQQGQQRKATKSVQITDNVRELNASVALSTVANSSQSNTESVSNRPLEVEDSKRTRSEDLRGSNPRPSVQSVPLRPFDKEEIKNLYLLVLKGVLVTPKILENLLLTAELLQK